MDFLKSGLKTVLGAPEPGQVLSGAETVERLVDRVNNSTLLEDRRDACRALKAMSRKYRVEVGAQGMDTLKQVLELDRADMETINYALDTLNNIMSPTQFEEEEANPQVPMNIGEQFTEMYIKDHNNIQLILDLLDEYDFRVRLSAVQLLTSLLTNRPKDIQEIILVKPMGVSKMMDLLSDTREVIRNETLLLLIRLTKGNANIQKIVAFENAFDRLFEIVSTEGYSDGGIIVEDCLLLMLNLLKNNSSNINFFKEGSYIQKMLPMFNTPDEADDLGWSPQKVSNVHCMLQIVRTLVSPSNSAQIISSCQKIMRNGGLLESLCNILMASGVPADILTETINTVGEAVRGDMSNQDFLGSIMAPSNPPRPAIVVLLMSMVNEKQPFSLRCAVLYCFQCYLCHNESSQAALVQTLLPSSADVSTLSSGQLLCGGLFSSDVLSNWFAAVALMHALIDNPQQKEQLLRVLLATNIGSSPVSLLHQCTVLLQQSTKLQSKVALLMLLSQWMSHCPAAVSAFLAAPGAVVYLVNQTGSNEHDDNECLLQGLSAFLLAICIHFNDDSVENYSKDSLKQLLVKRIGMETFTAKLSEVSRHEAYSRAAKHPQLRAKASSDILVDYEFCRLFKVLESVLIQSLTARPQPENGEDPAEGADGGTLAQYKSLIRQQDARLHELIAQIDQLLRQNNTLQAALNDSQAANSHLKDENTLLKAQASAALSRPLAPAPPRPDDTMAKEYESRVEKLTEEVLRLNNKMAADAEAHARTAEELDTLKKDQDDLLLLLADQKWDTKMPKRKQNTSEKGFVVEEFTSIDGPDAKRWRPWRSGTPPPTSSADHCLVPETAVTLRPETDTVPTGCTGSAVSDAGKPVPHYYDNTMARAEIIPLFDPEKPDLFAYQWIQKIEQLSVIHNWSDSTRSYFMQSRLGGMARTWHASLPNYNLTWSEWKAELLKAFPYNIDYAESLRDMLSRKKGLNESMAQYFYQKNALLTRLDIWGEKAVACIIDGLPPHMKAPARAGNFATPTDFYSKFLAMMEDKPKFNNQPIRPRTEQPRSDGDINNVNQNRDVRKPITCFLCNEPGHTVRRCPKNASRPTCTTCGKVGHSSEKCWSRSGAGVIPPVPSTTPINIISPEVNETYFRDVTIDDVNVRAYFDSGAKINVASLEFSKQLRSPLLPCDYVVAGFGGGTVLAKGQHHVTLKIKDIVFSTTLVIVDSDMRNPQVILGQPIINDPNIKFIVTGNTLHIEKTQEDPFTEIMMIDDIHLNSNRIEVRCKEDTIVPPQTRLIVNVQCVGIIEDSVVFIESRTCLCDYRDYSIPSALFSGKGGALQVCNRSETPLLLEKGTLLARGLQCADAVYELVDGTLESRAEYQILAIDIDKVQCACSSEAETKLIKLLEEYADCFSSNTEELGCTDKIKMKIELNSDKPICYRPYRLSEAEKAVVREKISDLTRNNIIRESTSPFSSPIVLVKKKDGDYRLCVDYRKLNSITVKDRYPLPIIEEQVEKLGGKRFFTNLDMSQGFYQIPLEKESIPKTGFSTPEGHYEFLRMPFGLANSPSVYQRLMDTILGSLRHEQVLPYMDDLLIASESETEALETLRIVLAIIRDAKLTLNLSKCRFLQKEVQYLGYEISEIGIRPGTKKLEAVSKYKEPTNIHELRMFLGLTSYFRKFVKGYALIAHDLYKLLKKNEPWMWGKLQQNAFNELKEILTTGPVLALYNCKAETEVHTDASSKGVAGILLQRNGGEMRPVAYFSRKTSREEAFYHSYELECLAVVESLKRFRIYLAGIDFKVVTDCAAVRQTFEKRDLLPRIARWWLSIQEYTFTIVHRPGTTHKHVDALSRAPTDDSISASVLVLDLMDWIVCMQNQDPKICIIRDKLEHKENDPDVQNNYVLLDNKVYRKCCNDQLRLVIPKYCKWNIMRKYHDDVGHPGLKKCDALIKENCWFSGMTRFIRKYVNGCLDCAYKRGQYGKHEGELHPIEKADKPMDTLHIDHAGPFCKSKKGNSYLFVIVDAFTKFVWAKPCRTTKTAEVIEKLMEIFSEFGYPRRIISDSGTAFTSKSFREFCVRNQIKHVKNAVASPRSNGQVERYNRTLIEAINKSTNDEREWDFCLSKVMWGTNNTLNSTTGFTPYRLMFQASRSLFQGMGFNVADTDQCARENAEKAKKNIDKTALSMKKRFDAKRKRPTQYKVNELVLWQKSDTGSKDVRRKLKEKFSGPYKIKKCLGNDRYLISALKGLKGYKKFTAVVASDALRKFVEGKDSDTESNDSDVDSTEELIDLLEG